MLEISDFALFGLVVHLSFNLEELTVTPSLTENRKKPSLSNLHKKINQTDI